MLNRNNKPTELQRYKKNTKQKKILIGTIVLFLLIIGGIKLYRTFALYKEEKSFNVLKGIVPDFHTYYKESILNGAYPELKGDLIPVTIDEEGTVRKANINEPWYSYEKQEWANAIIKQNSYDALDAYGKVNGATKEDGYVSLDGVDDYIDLGLENHDFGNTASVAIRGKIKQISTEEDRHFICNIEQAGFDIFIYHSNQQLGFSFYDSNTKTYKSVLSGEMAELNKTYTLVGTYDGKEMKFYIDGKLVGSREINGKITSSTMPFNIGANPNNGGINRFSNIDVYQAAIFDRVLTEDEIKSDFSNEIKIHNNSELLKYVDFTEREEEAEEIIPEDIIESYFVWIPKYRYKLFNTDNFSYDANGNVASPHEIEIKFGLTNTIESDEECVAPPSGEKGNCGNGKWMTHPAFLAFDTKGIWVGKFETGYKGATSTIEAQQNNVETDKIIIKPNVYSWSYIYLINAYKTSYEYKRDLESHMMKNTEWGAVAYLTQSIYGRCDKNTKTCEEIMINNANNFVTGVAAKNKPTTGLNAYTEYGHIIPYQSNAISNVYPTSMEASTTKNNTGIFDMSGGIWELVMGIMLDESGTSIYEDTKLKKEDLPDPRYYDTYKYFTNLEDYTRGIFGDATSEMGPFKMEDYTTSSHRNISGWYQDESWFIYKDSLYMLRGGSASSGVGCGIFTLSRNKNGIGSPMGYRLVLAI